MSKSFADVMASGKNGRRRVTERVFFAAEIAEEYQALSLEYVAAKQKEEAAAATRDPEKPDTTKRLAGGDSPSTAILKQMQALVDENSDAYYDVTFEQMRRHDWLQLRTQHGPRDDVEDERLFNTDTFPPAAVTASMLDPEPTDEVLAFFAENLSNGEWERLANIVWNLNEGVRSVPKAETDLLSLLLAGDANA